MDKRNLNLILLKHKYFIVKISDITPFRNIAPIWVEESNFELISKIILQIE
jgi:hypothetical protein